MNNDEIILSADHITKEFSGTPVLQGVSFDVHAGEIIGLVGENGAGKTTLMNMILANQKGEKRFALNRLLMPLKRASAWCIRSFHLFRAFPPEKISC